ncbi:MAG: ornithine carbamoyltransferase [Methanolinea sp.]|jgi:ornithine carbamoyltransferase|nr:ornithine carbamoyltransferase [Methanolinea sp.]
MKRDIISILDLSSKELDEVLEQACRLKRMKKERIPHLLLPGKTLAMIFEKSSTRTRISFEVGIADLGGTALFLNAQDMQIGRGEEIRDTARVASRYVSGVMIRAYRHSTIEEFARYATIPVINGLSDLEHPCQILADIMTIREHFGDRKGLRVGWVGDGDNVCNSLILSTILTGMEITVATPKGFEPPAKLVETARRMGSRVTLVRDPKIALEDAHVVATDTWVSMGTEKEREARLRAFKGFTIDRRLMDLASPDAIFMHCLPAHRGQEVTDEVIEGPFSVVFDEAENRLHAQKALMVFLMQE